MIEMIYLKIRTSIAVDYFYCAIFRFVLGVLRIGFKVKAKNF